MKTLKFLYTYSLKHYEHKSPVVCSAEQRIAACFSLNKRPQKDLLKSEDENILEGCAVWRVCGVCVACVWRVCGVCVGRVRRVWRVKRACGVSNACVWRVRVVFVACLRRMCGVSETYVWRV